MRAPSHLSTAWGFWAPPVRSSCSCSRPAPWPGYKAGALNEATRRLPAHITILGIVDADYVVRPGFLKEMVGHFADDRVAFVQTPQNYRDWKDSGYLRGLFYSYRYFFDVT